MPIIIFTPREIAVQIAERIRDDRLSRGWTQAQLSERAGISPMTYRLFERTGRISLERLLAIASALGRTTEWEVLFRSRAAQSLDELDPARPLRRRGARKRPPRRRPESEAR